MANYVCTALSAKNILTGLQTCNTWSEYIEPNLLPDLTTDQVSQIATKIFIFLAVCFIYRQLRKSAH